MRIIISVNYYFGIPCESMRSDRVSALAKSTQSNAPDMFCDHLGATIEDGARFLWGRSRLTVYDTYSTWEGPEIFIINNFYGKCSRTLPCIFWNICWDRFINLCFMRADGRWLIFIPTYILYLRRISFFTSPFDVAVVGTFFLTYALFAGRSFFMWLFTCENLYEEVLRAHHFFAYED